MKIFNFRSGLVTVALLVLGITLTSYKKIDRLVNPIATADPGKPTIVLVHGAFADGSSWSKVIPLLQKQGYQTIAVQNPLTSFSDDVASVNRILAEIEGPVVLVGHSWAGMVITEAGNNPNVKSLVYIAAYAPDLNESVLAMTKDAYEVKKYPVAPALNNRLVSDDGYIRLSEDAVVNHFAQDLPKAEAQIVYAVQGRFHSSTLSATVSKPAWKTKPSFYAVSDNDQVISPLMEQDMAKKIGAKIFHLKASHVSMLSKPQEVTKIIIEAAQKN